MSENVQSRSRALAKLAATIVVAGALLAGLLLPWVGGTGVVARNSASLLDALPVELTDKTPAGNTRVLAADGSLITNLYENNRTPVTSDQISEVMKQALVDIEDSRFYAHNGLDVQGTMRALVKNLAAGEVQEGGSTLTQQLVKQTLLQAAVAAGNAEGRDAAVEQDGAEGVSRKLREARLALALEETYSKDEILTRYLNLVYFGQGAYGIQAAAQRYFSVNAIDLTLPQAAMLAGLVQSPTNDDPIGNPENALIRRNQVLERMHSLTHISDQQLAEASAQPVAVVEGAAPPNGCINAALGGFFCDYALTYLTNTLGISPDLLDNGGLTIQTTLRPDLQQSADQGVLGYVPMGDAFAGILTAVQPGTGHVLAMSENRRFGCAEQECESVNLNVVASAGSGSTYKAFTAAAALTAGFGSNYTLHAPQPYTSKVFKQNGGTRGAPYRPSNDNAGYADTYNMTSGLVASSNTYFVALEDALGSVQPVVDAAKAMGMHFDQTNHLAECGNKCDDFGTYIGENELGSFTLGPVPTSPLDLANAYATLAARGTRCETTPVTAILDRAGQPLKDDDGTVIDTADSCTPGAIAPGVADTLNQMLTQVVESGTGRKAAIGGIQIAGKTGTIQGNKSATFVGTTPNYAVSVMYFNPKTQEDVGGHGGGLPAQVFRAAMEPILTSEPVVPFPPADPAVAAGTRGTGYVPPPPAPEPAPEPAPTDQPPPGEPVIEPPADPGDGNNGRGPDGRGNG